MVTTLKLASVLLTAVAMSAGFAHLLELPNKIVLSAEDYLTVQQIYRGWALLGGVIFAALACTLALAFVQRRHRRAFGLSAGAVACIAASLVVFFAVTYPANQATRNWTVLPEGWESLRQQWEYGHAVSAGLYFMALAALVLSLAAPPAPERRAGT
jgi:hypothetical protein